MAKLLVFLVFFPLTNTPAVTWQKICWPIIFYSFLHKLICYVRNIKFENNDKSVHESGYIRLQVLMMSWYCCRDHLWKEFQVKKTNMFLNQMISALCLNDVKWEIRCLDDYCVEVLPWQQTCGKKKKTINQILSGLGHNDARYALCYLDDCCVKALPNQWK